MKQLPNELSRYTHSPRNRYPLRHYIYFWRNGLDIFYVGVGTNRRAWNDHLPYLENVRRTSPFFNVVIYRDDLTKEAAHKLERKLIVKLSQKHSLLNKKVPQKV